MTPNEFERIEQVLVIFSWFYGANGKIGWGLSRLCEEGLDICTYGLFF